MMRCLLLSLFLVMISACETLPQFGGGSVPEAMDDENAALEGEAGIESAGEQKPLISPYEQNQPTVSRDAKERFSRSLAFMQQQDWQAAEPILRALIIDYPNLSGPILNLAIVLEQQGDLPAAENYYQQAIDTNPANLNAYHCFAVLLRQQGRFAEAEQVYLAALDIWQQDKVSHKNLAILYDIYMGRLEQALFHYQQYLDLNQDADRQVQGWVADLSRRLKTVSSVTAGQ